MELRPGGVPLLHDLPLLEAMQTYPHVIGMINREEYWNPHTSKRGEAQLIFVKNSDNPLGVLRFGFEPQFSRFLELDVLSQQVVQLTRGCEVADRSFGIQLVSHRNAPDLESGARG